MNTIEFDRTPQVGDIVFCKIFAESSGYCDDPEVCEVWSVHESVNDDLFLVYVMSLINNNLSNVLYWNTAKNDWDDDQKCSETDRARLVIDDKERNIMDGNLASLRAYEREQDALEDQDNALLKAQQELSNDLFDGYFEGNSACVDWIDEVILDDEDTANNLLDKMRAQYLKPLAANMRTAYSIIIIDVCDYLAAQQKTHEDIERERHECGL